MTPDRDLLTQIAEGDKAAMAVFFERYERPLFAFLCARGADAQEADDAVQDAMLDVWRTAGRFSGQSSAKTWLFTIGRNKLVDRMRKTSRMSFVDDVPDMPDDTPSAEAVLISAGDAARVQTCLSKLKPAHLAVMRLAFFDDLNYAQIGAIEDIPEGTVKTRIYHAKKAAFALSWLAIGQSFTTSAIRSGRAESASNAASRIASSGNEIA